VSKKLCYGTWDIVNIKYEQTLLIVKWSRVGYRATHLVISMQKQPGSILLLVELLILLQLVTILYFRKYDLPIAFLKCFAMNTNSVVLKNNSNANVANERLSVI